MKTKFGLLCIFAAQIAFGQGSTPQIVAKIVTVARGDPQELANLGCVGQMVCEPSRSLKAVVLKGTPEKVAQAEQNIKQLDALTISSESGFQKNVELTIYAIAGSTTPVEGMADVNGEALNPAIKQLRAVFPYSHYQLLSTMLLRSSSDSGAHSSGLMTGFSTSADFNRPSRYVAEYDRASTTSANSVHIKAFRFLASVPTPTAPIPKDKPNTYATIQYIENAVEISSSLDLREGQKVVIGKANVSGSDTCLFIVVSARIVP